MSNPRKAVPSLSFNGKNVTTKLKEYLESITECSPQELADQITAFASSFIPAARDDMTALVGALLKREAP